MSRKWNIFRKKGSKADSHGTTSANEDIEFQPAPAEHDLHWSSSSSSTQSREFHSDNADTSARRDSGPKHPVFPSLAGGNVKPHIDSASEQFPKKSKQFQNHAENGGMRLRKDSLSSKFMDMPYNSGDSSQKGNNKNMYDNTDNGFGPDQRQLVAEATINRTSPRAPKKLIKPGDVNAQQPAYLTQQPNNSMVRIVFYQVLP